MDRDQPNSPPGNLNDLPDDSPQVRAAVAALRWRAVEENLEVRQSDLSDACLIRFLRCRDFDSNLAWKVKGSRSPGEEQEHERPPSLLPPLLSSRLARGFLQVTLLRCLARTLPSRHRRTDPSMLKSWKMTSL